MLNFVVPALVAAVVLFLVKRIMGGGNTSSVEKPTKSTSTTTTPTKVLDPKEFRKFKLIKKEYLTSGVLCPVVLFRFEIPNNQPLGLPIGQHISLRTTVKNENGEEEEVIKSYTPTSSNDDFGYFDLVVKVYPKGRMSQFLNNLNIGDSIEVRGPNGRFLYEKNKYDNLGMIAGGTGITPMLQIASEILKREDDKTKVSLIFGNITVQDIILKDKIDEMVKQHPDKFKVYYVLNEAPNGWDMGVGYITKDMIAAQFAPKGERNRILVCGPPPMNDAMKKNFTALELEKDKDFFIF